jgi:hypothetical protein
MAAARNPDFKPNVLEFIYIKVLIDISILTGINA